MPEKVEKPVTLRTLHRRVRDDQKFAVLTCYDATTATWLMRGGVDVLLVGDTAAEMILGYESTIHAPMDFMVTITAAVQRGAPGAFVMADMPFMSYQADDAEAIRNAGRFMTEGRAAAVKLEVDIAHGDLVQRMTHAGVPVVAHIGSRPQQVAMTGGYRAAGRTAAEARRLVETAELAEARGAVMLLIEATASEVSQRIVERVSIPVIGCGAGPACHGHVVVLQDLLGMTDWQPPFAPPAAQLGNAIQRAASDWVEKIRSGDYLTADHPYHMSDDELAKFNRG